MYNLIIGHFKEDLSFQNGLLNDFADSLQNINEDFGFIPLDHSLYHLYEAIDSIIDAINHLDVAQSFYSDVKCINSENK